MTVSLQVTSIVYLGIGATLVILTGGIDLSVGSVLALSGVAAALSVKGRRAGGAGHAHWHRRGRAVRRGQRALRHACFAAALHRHAGHDVGRVALRCR